MSYTTSAFPDGSLHFSIAYSASLIEEKIENSSGFYCNSCRNVFDENKKLESFDFTVLRRKPCISTFDICKITEKFFKLFDIRDNTQNVKKFRVIYCLIFRSMDMNSLFPDSKFDCDFGHRYHFIKCIVGIYLSHRAADISREITYGQHEKLLRQQLNHAVIFEGQ